MHMFVALPLGISSTVLGVMLLAAIAVVAVVAAVAREKARRLRGPVLITLGLVVLPLIITACGASGKSGY